MNDTDLKRVCRWEAERGHKSTVKWLGADDVPIDEVIVPPPPQSYRPPSFLSQTTTRDQVDELTGLMAEVQRINEENAGLITRETEVMLELSGRTDDLGRRIQQWTDRYLRHRLDPARANPRDQGDPMRKADRIAAEFSQILGHFCKRPRTLNYVFTERSILYAGWLLAQETWWKHFGFSVNDQGQITARRPNQPGIDQVLTKLSNLARQQRWLNDRLGKLYTRVAPNIAACVGRHAAATEQMLRDRLEDMIDDIQEMRPLLVRNFRTEKSAVPLTDGSCVCWAWRLRFGLGFVAAMRDERELLATAASGNFQAYATVSYNGELLDPDLPWITLAGRMGKSTHEALAANAVLLETMRDKLLEFYSRIDLRPARPVEDWSDVGSDELIAQTCHQLAEDDTPAPTPADEAGGVATIAPAALTASRLPTLRMQSLLRLLERQFGCEVQQGKGSEVTVYRPGGRKFTLGCHRRNQSVPSMLIAMLLKRVGIGPREWWAAVG